MSGTRLLYLRHGETDLTVRHGMQGISDLPLNARGREQAARAAERLAGEGIDVIYASDLRRARESAEIVAGRTGGEVATDPRLREQDLGDWEGLSWPDLATEVGSDALDRFLGDFDFGPPGGETKRALSERVCPALDELARTQRGTTVLVVSHGGPLMVFMHAVLAIPFGRKKRFYPSNAGLSEFGRMDGHWTLVTFNETSFMRGLGTTR